MLQLHMFIVLQAWELKTTKCLKDLTREENWINTETVVKVVCQLNAAIFN